VSEISKASSEAESHILTGYEPLVKALSVMLEFVVRPRARRRGEVLSRPQSKHNEPVRQTMWTKCATFEISSFRTFQYVDNVYTITPPAS